MKARFRKERTSLWHHTAFSGVIGLILVAIVVLRRDTPTFIFAGVMIIYILGNTLLHIRRKDFKSETLYEYILVAAAVFIVLLSSL